MSRRTRWARRMAAVLGVTVVTAVAACVDMASPNGPAWTSVLLLPSLYIVHGDTMRDTTGATGVPMMKAFDAAGKTLDAVAQFFITDSAPVAHFAPTGELVGDASGVVHVVGQIGNIQTPIVAVTVGVAPDTIVKSVPDTTLNVPVGIDSATSAGSIALGAIVSGFGDSLVQGVIVTYTLAPLVSRKNYPLAFLTDEAGNLSTVDTTDASGLASRQLVVNALALPATGTDTIVVTASAKYKNVPLKGAPLTFTIPVMVFFPNP